MGCNPHPRSARRFTVRVLEVTDGSRVAASHLPVYSWGRSRWCLRMVHACLRLVNLWLLHGWLMISTVPWWWIFMVLTKAHDGTPKLESYLISSYDIGTILWHREIRGGHWSLACGRHGSESTRMQRTPGTNSLVQMDTLGRWQPQEKQLE